MTASLPIIEARKRLTALPEQFAREPETGAVAVTRRGKPVLAVMPWDFYESLVETLEILGDETMMGALRQGIRELKRGRGVRWDNLGPPDSGKDPGPD